MTTIRAGAGRAASRSAAQRSAPSTPRQSPLPATARAPAPDADAGARPGTRRTIVIERVWPELDGGRHPVKRVVGDDFLVTADIVADGHDLLAAALLVRPAGEAEWHEVPMRLVENDRWSGRARLERLGRHRYTVEAWRDAWGTLMEALGKKVAAGVPVATELAEAAILLEEARARIPRGSAPADRSRMQRALATLRRGGPPERTARSLLDPELMAVMRRHPDRTWATRYPVELPLMVDRERARFGAWYELFPRSQGRRPGRASTLAEATWRLPELARLGFDVIYLPPIHPIGTVNRKGRNNTLTVGPDDPGSPWAIGSAAGGHTEVAPELGGLDAFLAFREAAEALGMEVAIDLALNAAPDHPWVRSHPEWFRHAPDGTIKYAENPPKKYQDIYPIDFYGASDDDRAALWGEWLRVVRLWIERGVRIFRVDNPHTKPVPFWGWLIGEVQREHPEVVFLAEAFTRPKMMRVLAKVGFSQSYTYFTWRETRDELRDYLTELTASEMREYYRGNLFTNTPDINPHHLDHGRPTFVVRLVMAATLSSSYGIYSGFELCEADRLDDREEYANSEKYEVRYRDWDARGNLKPLIAELNHLRREWPALQLYDNLRFEAATGDRVLFYRKALHDGEPDPLSGFPYRWRDAVYVAVNVDPRSTERGTLHPDLPALGIAWDEPYRLTDLLSGESRTERGADLAVDLTPGAPFRIFTISRIEGPMDR
jgi:starch synthase (maltosyl-transferring)